MIAQQSPHTNAPNEIPSSGAQIIPFVPREQLALEHAHWLTIAQQFVPQADRDELFETVASAGVSATTAGHELVSLAPTTFKKHRAELDRYGEPALWLPIFEDGQLKDFAVFHPRRLDLRRTWSGTKLFHSTGLERAVLDSNYHPQRRILVHHGPWSFIRSGCEGVLPVNWAGFALWVKAQAQDIRCTDDTEARRVRRELTLALKLPEIFVIEEQG
jgi:hypothetical protein